MKIGWNVDCHKDMSLRSKHKEGGYAHIYTKTKPKAEEIVLSIHYVCCNREKANMVTSHLLLDIGFVIEIRGTCTMTRARVLLRMRRYPMMLERIHVRLGRKRLVGANKGHMRGKRS